MGCFDEIKKVAVDILSHIEAKTGVKYDPETKAGKEEYLAAVKDLKEETVKDLASIHQQIKGEKTAQPEPSKEVVPPPETPIKEEVPNKEDEPSVTSIQNSIVDKERAKRGLPEATQSAKKEFGKSWDDAAKILDENPNAGDELVQELKNKSRPLTDTENAILLHRQITLQNSYDKVNEAVNKASEEKDNAGVQENKLKLAALSDALQGVYNVGKSTGTEQGRGLNTRKMLAKEDYTLASMETKKRAVNNGRPLTDEERSNLKVMSDRIDELEKKIADIQKEKAIPKSPKNKTVKSDKDFADERDIPSPEEQKAKIELERNKQKFRSELENDRKKNAGSLEKGLNFFVKWQRAFKLSSPISIAKLTMAALFRTTSTPIEEVIGGGVTALLPKSITEGAYREAGFNVKAESKAFTKQFTQGMKDAYATINLKAGGKSDLEVMHGKEGDFTPEAADFFGHLHGMLKAPVKRAEFERSLEKRAANMMKAGIDITDPLVQISMSANAYKDARRSIFMQDNAVSDFWQRNVIGNPTTDLGKFRSAIAQWLVPFAKIPTNIVGETINYSLGLPIGAVRLADALIKGTEKLTPEDKDMVVRLFKKGSIGAGFLAIGYLNPTNIGGYYTGKRNPDDTEVGGLRLFGADIPKFLVHNPLMEQLQLGATIRRVSDSFVGRSEEKQGIVKGVMEASLGLIEEVPFVNTAGQLNKLGNERDRDSFFDEMAKNTIEPALLQFVAKYTDSDVKRKPETLLEHIKMGIPGLRQQISPKREYSKEDLQIPSFKFFTDKGLALPYSSEKTVKIKDYKSRTIKTLSDYPEDIKDKYYDTRKKYLNDELKEIEHKGSLYVDRYGDISESKSSDHHTAVKINDMNRNQLAQVLSIASRKAAEKTKAKLFPQKK